MVGFFYIKKYTIVHTTLKNNPNNNIAVNKIFNGVGLNSSFLPNPNNNLNINFILLGGLLLIF